MADFGTVPRVVNNRRIRSSYWGDLSLLVVDRVIIVERKIKKKRDEQMDVSGPFVMSIERNGK